MMSAHESHESLQCMLQAEMDAGRTNKEGRYNQLDHHDHGFDPTAETRNWDTESDLKPMLRRRRSIWLRLKENRWLLDTALLLIILGLLVEKRWKHDDHKSHQYEVTGDMTGFAPTCEFTLEKTRNKADQIQSRSRL